MVEIKNVEVFNLERAQRAIENSFNVGEINTTEGSVKDKLARTLGSNMQSHQSHDAYLKGILVTYDIKGNGVFMPEFQRYHFVNCKPLEEFDANNLQFTKYVSKNIKDIILELAKKYNDNKSQENYQRLIQNLPRGIERWYRCTTNYLQLKTIVIQRFNHRNKEDWNDGFIKFCYSLPKFRELCGFASSTWEIS